MRRSPPFFRSSSCRLCSSSKMNLISRSSFFFLDGLDEFLQFFLVGEIGFLVELAFGQQLHEFRFAQAAAQLGGHLIVFLNIQKESGEVAAFERFAVLALHGMLFGGALHQLAGEFALVADVAIHFAALHAIQAAAARYKYFLFRSARACGGRKK